MSVGSALGQLLFRLLAPPRCSACDAGLSADVIFCPICAATVAPAPHVSDWGTSAAGYGGAVSTAITRMKFGGRPDLARPLAHLMLRETRHRFSSDLVVVPVPLHAARLRERGYNQAALLGRVVAAHLGCAFAPLALERHCATDAQARLGRASRERNVAGVFRLRRPQDLRNRRVLLVDDVRTTGATLEACRHALRAVDVQSAQSGQPPYFLTAAQA